MVNDLEKEQYVDQKQQEKENKDETSSESELLQLKKDFAKEYFEKLQKDSWFSLSWLLLSETWVIEDYLTEENLLDKVKDNVIKEVFLKKALTEDIISQLETVKKDITDISAEKKEEVKQKLEELRIKYNLKENTDKINSNEETDSSVPSIITPMAATVVASSTAIWVEKLPDDMYRSPFAYEQSKNKKLTITSLFWKRKHPVTGQEHMHTGIDIAENEWTIITSMCDWVVTKNKKTILGGREIYIKDATGKEFCFLHLKEKSPLSKGTVVKIWQEIWKVWNTWRSTGPHLHLTVKENGKSIDPIKKFPNIFEKNVA